METKLKNKWIKALKSGEYKKAKSKLYNHGKFCCLGVLCDIAGMEYDTCGGRRSYRLPGGSEDDPVTLTDEIKLAVGLSDQDEAELTRINDENKGWGEVIKYIKDNV